MYKREKTHEKNIAFPHIGRISLFGLPEKTGHTQPQCRHD
jgi:hypothetical protein